MIQKKTISIHHLYPKKKQIQQQHALSLKFSKKNFLISDMHEHVSCLLISCETRWKIRCKSPSYLHLKQNWIDKTRTTLTTNGYGWITEPQRQTLCKTKHERVIFVCRAHGQMLFKRWHHPTPSSAPLLTVHPPRSWRRLTQSRALCGKKWLSRLGSPSKRLGKRKMFGWSSFNGRPRLSCTGVQTTSNMITSTL